MSGLDTTHDGISPVLTKLIERATQKQGAFARVYPLYQKLQTERFQTENASEGNQWSALEAAYAAYKPRRYGGGVRHKWVGGRGADRPWQASGSWQSWPGGGRKMLFGTSTLAGAVIGPGDTALEGTDHHNVIFGEDAMSIFVSTGGTNAEGARFDYPKYVNDVRPFFRFSDDSVAQMRALVKKFMIKGDE